MRLTWLLSIHIFRCTFTSIMILFTIKNNYDTTACMKLDKMSTELTNADILIYTCMRNLMEEKWALKIVRVNSQNAEKARSD